MGKFRLFNEGRNDLFGDKAAMERPSTPHIGDEMHELTDAQIQNLIRVRFGNNSLLLIRQLSRDVASKEKQLILLRNDKFQREHELIRLCSEYSNLSTLEIESRLSERTTECDPEKALGEMVGLAVKETFVPDSTRFEVRTPSGSEYREHKCTKRTSLDLALPEDMKGEQVALTESLSSPLGTTTLRSTNFGAGSSNSLRTYWHDWLNVSDESVSLREERKEGDITNKPPVELKKIVPETENMPAVLSTGGATDRHGFYLNSPKSGSSELFNDVSCSDRNLSLAHATKVEGEPLKRFQQSLNKLRELSIMHDTESESLLLRWDELMREVSEEQRKAQSRKLDIEDTSVFGLKGCNLKRSDKGWTRHFAGKNMEATDTAKEFKTLQNLIHEDGIPPKYRNYLWMELSGAKDVSVPGEYRRLWGESYNTTSKRVRESIDQVNLDLHRTLPSNKFFRDVDSSLPGPQLAKLKRILYALVVYMPHIGYSQGMNKIVGNLLLGVGESNAANGSVKLDEEDVFWMFVAFIDDIIPRYDSKVYFDRASIFDIQQEIAITSSVFFKKFVPRLQAHFHKLGVDIQVILYGWWLGVFSECTTGVDAWFRFVDNLLITKHNDIKFIAFSLATLHVHEPALLGVQSAEEAYSFFNRLKQGAVTNVRFKDLNRECLAIESHISLAEMQKERARKGAPSQPLASSD